MGTRYDISLRIFYTYAQPTSLGRHLVRVQPRDLPGRQSVSIRHLSVLPAPTERREGVDFFGNPMAEIGFDGRAFERVEFRLKAWVERTSGRPGLDISPPLARLGSDTVGVKALDGESPHHFTNASPRVPHVSEIAAFARDIVEPTRSVLENVVALGEALHREMTFVSGVTDADTPAEEAFAQRRGVCQDYAHIMIAALRSVGVPAGYVSGFIRTIPPEGQPRLEGADAMHAWVRAWCGREYGWCEYDPTNAVLAGEDHVIVAYGRDYADVSPVRGVTRMSGVGGTGHAVDMVEL